MKLLLDQGLPRTAVKHLANAGIVAEHVGDETKASGTESRIGS
jgi:predicted nuclease of predicted toxin-antitoxin system